MLESSPVSSCPRSALKYQKCPFPNENDYLAEVTMCRSYITGFQSRPCGHILCSKSSTFHWSFRTVDPFGPSHENWNSHYSQTFSITFGNSRVHLSTVMQLVSNLSILNSHYSPLFSITFASWCLQWARNECSVWSTDVWVVTTEFWLPFGPKLSKVSLSEGTQRYGRGAVDPVEPYLVPKWPLWTPLVFKK